MGPADRETKHDVLKLGILRFLQIRMQMIKIVELMIIINIIIHGQTTSGRF